MWEQARAWLDDEQAEVDAIQHEVDRWTELKNKELDLELWRDYDKGAKEAQGRLAEAIAIRDEAQAAFEAEDSAKQVREADAAAAQAAADAERAYMERDWAIWDLEAEIADLEY